MTLEYTLRPWGEYKKLFQESSVWVKRVEVKPGHRLSLQRHLRRSEKWIIVTGTAKAEVEGLEHILSAGSVIDIPVGSVHRLANIGNDDVVFIEVACGNYLGEDDIIRIQDDYHREATDG